MNLNLSLSLSLAAKIIFNRRESSHEKLSRVSCKRLTQKRFPCRNYFLHHKISYVRKYSMFSHKILDIEKIFVGIRNRFYNLHVTTAKFQNVSV